MRAIYENIILYTKKTYRPPAPPGRSRRCMPPNAVNYAATFLALIF